LLGAAEVAALCSSSSHCFRVIELDEQVAFLDLFVEVGVERTTDPLRRLEAVDRCAARYGPAELTFIPGTSAEGPGDDPDQSVTRRQRDPGADSYPFKDRASPE
jgi:hypothetical protein